MIELAPQDEARMWMILAAAGCSLEEAATYMALLWK